MHSSATRSGRFSKIVLIIGTTLLIALGITFAISSPANAATTYKLDKTTAYIDKDALLKKKMPAEALPTAKTLYANLKDRMQSLNPADDKITVTKNSKKKLLTITVVPALSGKWKNDVPKKFKSDKYRLAADLEFMIGFADWRVPAYLTTIGETWSETYTWKDLLQCGTVQKGKDYTFQVVTSYAGEVRHYDQKRWDNKAYLNPNYLANHDNSYCFVMTKEHTKKKEITLPAGWYLKFVCK